MGGGLACLVSTWKEKEQGKGEEWCGTRGRGVWYRGWGVGYRIGCWVSGFVLRVEG